MNNKLISYTLLFGWLALCPLAVAATADDYTQRMPLATTGNSTWYQLEIPAAVQFSASYADLRDLRVFNSEGEALPYSLLTAHPQQKSVKQTEKVHFFPLFENSEDKVGSDNLQLRRNQNGVLIELPAAPNAATQVRRGWLLDLSQIRFTPEHLHIELSEDVPGLQRFTLAASDDLSHWTHWDEGQIAQMSYNQKTINRTDIALHGLRANYLRLNWIAPHQAPLLKEVSISGVQINKEAAALVWSAAWAGERVADQQKDVFIWKLPYRMSPQRLRLAVPPANTIVRVTMSGRQLQKNERETSLRRSLSKRQRQEAHWWPLGSGVVYRLAMSDATDKANSQERLQDELEPYNQEVDELRLEFDKNSGGASEEMPQLSLALPAHTLVFLARGTPPFQLAFARPEAYSEALPLSTLIPGTDNKTDISNQPGVGRAEVITNASVAPTPAPAATAPGISRWLLWSVLLGGVLLVGVMAVMVIRGQKTDR